MLRPQLIGLLHCNRVDTVLSCKFHGHDILLYCAKYGLKNVLANVEFYLLASDYDRLYKVAIIHSQDEVVDHIIPRAGITEMTMIRKAIKRGYARIFQIMNVQPDDYMKLIIKYQVVGLLPLCTVDLEALKHEAIKYDALEVLRYAIKHGAKIRAEDIVFASTKLEWDCLNILYGAAPHLINTAIECAGYDSRTQQLLIGFKRSKQN
jgi:hypothetical protein